MNHWVFRSIRLALTARATSANSVPALRDTHGVGRCVRWPAWALAGCLLGSLLAGCSSSRTAQPERADRQGAKGQPVTAQQSNGKSANAKAAPPGPVVEDASFELRAETKTQYSRGAESSLSIVLTPRGAFHVNEEYPIRVRLTAPPAVGLVKVALEKNDATEFSKQRARFDVPFVASQAGSSKVRADVSFAVCTEENCVPDERTLEFTVAVQ